MAQLLKQDSPVRDFDLLKSLEIFLVVAEVGNMTAAAGRLHITQSAISQQIKMLEQDFGGPLFYRDVRPLRLTPAGATLKNRAGALLLEARQLRSEVRQAAFGNLPHLRIAILSTFARHLVPAILRAVQSKDLAATNVTISRTATSISPSLRTISKSARTCSTSSCSVKAIWSSHRAVKAVTFRICVPLVRACRFCATRRGRNRGSGSKGICAACA